MKSVRFVKNSPPYNKGEVAGFPDDQANRLIASGLAVDVLAEDGAPPPALREDGPTIAEYVKAGYPASAYPPAGYAPRSSEAEIVDAVRAETEAKAAAQAGASAKKAAKPAAGSGSGDATGDVKGQP